MAGSPISEINYHEFRRAVQRAADTGTKIEVTDKARWDQWVKKNQVREVFFRSFAGSKFDKLKAVIIDSDDPNWRGFYLFSESEEAAMRWAVAVPAA
jgi:hypothetical protein